MCVNSEGSGETAWSHIRFLHCSETHYTKLTLQWTAMSRTSAARFESEMTFVSLCPRISAISEMDKVSKFPQC